jgi:hypothetical protein
LPENPLLPFFRRSLQTDSVAAVATSDKLLIREESMKTTALAALLLGSAFAAGTAAAQPFPFNQPA